MTNEDLTTRRLAKEILRGNVFKQDIQLEEAMAKKGLKKEKAFEILWNNGFFYGWDKIVKEYEPSRQEAASYKASLYKKLLDEVLEAKKEAARLQTVIGQLEAKCRMGMQEGRTDPMSGWDSNANGLRENLRAFDGWVVSLLESDITLLHYVQNIETASLRVTRLHDAFGNLAKRRMKEQQLFASDSKGFELVPFHP